MGWTGADGTRGTDVRVRPSSGSGQLVAEGLTVQLRDGRVLLDGVDLVLAPGQLTAIVGPSGSGKSTLLGALCGIRPATSGVVLYDRRDLYREFGELRHRIGHVPQDEVLHTQLPLRRVLDYTAALRFGPEVDGDDRRARIEEVLAELGLGDRGDVVIENLSGGQQQRASVGLELLTRPSMLFLDEPTAGLDPGYERSVTRLFRQLADGGRTVVVVTHAVSSLALCDTVVFLSPGGRLAYVGAPGTGLEWFGAADYPDVFLELEANGDEWADRFAASPIRAERIGAPLAEHRAELRAASVSVAPANDRPSAARHQLGTLTRRTADVLRSTPSHFRLLAAQAPVIALLLLVAVGFGNLGPAGIGRQPRLVIAVLMLGAVTMGLVNSCREIVRELAVYRRERTVGLSLPAYLGSKFIVFGAVGLLQSIVLVGIVVTAQDGPRQSVLIRPPILELGLLVFLTTLAAVALGLAVSAWVGTDAAALVLVPVLLIAQLVLSDSIISIEDKPLLAQAAWVSPSYWGFQGQAASVHLGDLELLCRVRAGAEAMGNASQRAIVDALLGQAPCRERWAPTRANVSTAAGALVGLTGLYGGLAALGLRRRDPRRRS